jgi:hypothetical protein
VLYNSPGAPLTTPADVLFRTTGPASRVRRQKALSELCCCFVRPDDK